MQTKFNLKKMVIAIVACLSFTQMACQKENKIAKPEAETLIATGDSLSIVSTLEQFRNLLGSTLNTNRAKLAVVEKLIGMVFLLA